MIAQDREIRSMGTHTQDPKYDIENGRLVGASTGQPIPDDEPIFILRGKDVHAVDTLMAYHARVASGPQDMAASQHCEAVRRRIHDFKQFAKDNPGRMKKPDTVYAEPRTYTRRDIEVEAMARAALRPSPEHMEPVIYDTPIGLVKLTYCHLPSVMAAGRDPYDVEWLPKAKPLL
jgi:hypothetical protein